MRRHLVLGVFSYLAMTSFVLAQTATGVIRGTVQDSAGSVLIQVRVRLIDEARNQEREQTTNDEGFFEFRALPLGNYRVEVEHPQFKKQAIEGVVLQVAETKNLRVILEVGSLNELVVVQADRGLLDGSDATLSQVIDGKRLLGLPINGRNVVQLVSLSAGVINAGRASATQRQANYGPGFSVGGQRDNTSVVLIDGIEISGQELNNYPLAIPPLDSVAEFRVQTSNYSAEFGGNSGAIINVASKRGSNEFHVTLFEFLRNDALDARNPFSTTVDPLKRNQFGLVASGPVILPKLYNGKNKLFWMFAYEGTRRRQAVTSTTLVPTLKERSGDFSGLPVTIVDPITKIPFPGNVIPANKINPVGAALANLYPVPNNTDPSRTSSAIHAVFPITTPWLRESTTSLELETRSGVDGPEMLHSIAAWDRLFLPHSPDSIRNSRTTTCSLPSETFIPSVRRSSMNLISASCAFNASVIRLTLSNGIGSKSWALKGSRRSRLRGRLRP